MSALQVQSVSKCKSNQQTNQQISKIEITKGESVASTGRSHNTASSICANGWTLIANIYYTISLYENRKKKTNGIDRIWLEPFDSMSWSSLRVRWIEWHVSSHSRWCVLDLYTAVVERTALQSLRNDIWNKQKSVFRFVCVKIKKSKPRSEDFGNHRRASTANIDKRSTICSLW